MQGNPPATITLVELDRCKCRGMLKLDEGCILCICLGFPEGVICFDASTEPLSQASKRLRSELVAPGLTGKDHTSDRSSYLLDQDDVAAYDLSKRCAAIAAETGLYRFFAGQDER